LGKLHFGEGSRSAAIIGDFAGAGARRRSRERQPFRSCKAPPPPTGLLGRPPPDKFRVLQKTQQRTLGIMANDQVDKSAEIYVKVAGMLLVVLLAYGAASLAGFIR
jgi:hypothetical protein